MVTTYYGLTVCATSSTSGQFANCQPYKVQCDIIPGTNFDFNCSSTLPAFGDMECAELHPPPDICKQLTVVKASPLGVNAVAYGGLANVTVGEAMCKFQLDSNLGITL